MHALRPQDSTSCLDIGYEVNKRYYNFFSSSPSIFFIFIMFWDSKRGSPQPRSSFFARFIRFSRLAVVLFCVEFLNFPRLLGTRSAGFLRWIVRFWSILDVCSHGGSWMCCRGLISTNVVKGQCPSGGSLPRAWSGRNGLLSPATGTWRRSPSAPPRVPLLRRRPTSTLATIGPPQQEKPPLWSSRKRLLPLLA